MKAIKVRLRQRASKSKRHGEAPISQDAAELWEMDHDHPDPDLIRFGLERSPKQENL